MGVEECADFDLLKRRRASDIRSSTDSLSHNIYKQQECYLNGNIGINSEFEEDGEEDVDDMHNYKRKVEEAKRYQQQDQTYDNNQEDYDMDGYDDGMDNDADHNQDYQYYDDEEELRQNKDNQQNHGG